MLPDQEGNVMGANKGWICLHRSIKESAIWTDDEPFDQRSAWIDLLLTANHEDREIFFDGHVRTVKRGQMLTSVEKLSARWKWNKKKTLKYLRLLEEAKMIERKSDKRGQQLTLLNYAKYQGFQGIEGQQMGHQHTHQHTHQVPDSIPTNNNINNYNNDNNISSSPRPFTPYKGYGDKPKQTMFHNGEQNHYDFAELERQLLERDRTL